ncbi:MAG: aminopeptidase [Promethearchaeota archaeon]
MGKISSKSCCRSKKGDRVLIIGGDIAKDLFLAVQKEVLIAGGHPLLHVNIEGGEEILYKYASDEQLEYFDDVFLKIIREFDCMINIFSDYNCKKLSTVRPEKIGKVQKSPNRREFNKIFAERAAKKELRWTLIPFPCNAFAQEAGMDLFSYTDFVEKALLLDKEDPIKEWKNFEEKQEKIVDYLNKVKEIQVIGEDTDLKLSVEGRTWINCSGHENLPDGEVFTGPVENSVNGKIRFTYPGIYMGKEIENIYLEFKDGKVVHASAEKGEDLLNEILKIENADTIGEFAIGTNYGITKFTKNMLFDEKIGGTLHCALGLGFPETGSKNVSSIHWDILKDMKTPGSKILADGKVIYEEGQWKI